MTRFSLLRHIGHKYFAIHTTMKQISKKTCQKIEGLIVRADRSYSPES